jgi:hypothetical protein
LIPWRAAQNSGDGHAQLVFADRIFEGVGHLLRLRLVCLGGSEHHHEEGEKQSDKVRIGD